MANHTPDPSRDEHEPSESTEAARLLRDVLAAERGVDLAAIGAARAVSSPPGPDLEPERESGSGRKVAGALVVTAALVAGGIYARVSSSPGGVPDVLAAAPTTVPAIPTSAPQTTVPAMTIPSTTIPPTTRAPTTIPPTTAPPTTAPPAAQPERGAVYKDGKLILQGAVPSREVADAFVEKAAEVIGAGNVIDDYVIDPSAEVPTDGRVVVDDPVLFATGSIEISPDFYPLLDLGVAVMRLNPQVVMIVEGHTDEVGETDRNQRLSEERARAVVAYITEKGGIDGSRFEVEGRGETDPVAANDTPEGRQQNRRIEVQLINLLTPA